MGFVLRQGRASRRIPRANPALKWFQLHVETRQFVHFEDHQGVVAEAFC